MSVTDDGERAYVAGTTAGFYVLDTEAIAHHTDAELAAGTAGCNQRSTIVSADGVIDPSKLPALANDCVHMVVNNDPGLKAFLASNASAQAKAERYLVLLTRSRFDVYPPVNATPTGTHSAVFVPNRPAQVKGNTKGRPAYVWLTDENGGCPLNYARMVSVESEITPIMVGAFAIPDNQLDECLEPGESPSPMASLAQQVAQQNHNPTVFKNLVFNTWYGHGLRAIDISIPQTPREVGYAMPLPQGIARTYPVFKDGLIYWADNRTGLHVARYTGPGPTNCPARVPGCTKATPPVRIADRKAKQRPPPDFDRRSLIRFAFSLANRAGLPLHCALVLVLAASVSIAVMQNATPEEETAYVCPMHADYTMDVAGKCPRCGMDLVRARARSTSAITSSTSAPCRPS